MSFALSPSNLQTYKTLLGLMWRHGHQPTLRKLGLHNDEHSPSHGETDGEPNVADPECESDPPKQGPEALACDLEELGPTYVKLAQVMSSQLNVLPPEYVSALARLRDHVEPTPFEEMAKVIEEDLGQPVHKLFDHVDPEPLGSASIGQVYKAEVGGLPVAVKIQRPDAAEQIERDLEAFSHIFQALDQVTGGRYNLVDVFEHGADALRRELDFSEEADNMRTFGKMVPTTGNLCTPRVFDGLTAGRVITMTHHEGVSVSQLGESKDADQPAIKRGPELANDLFALYLQNILVDGFFHADPHPGNVLLDPMNRLVLLDLGRVGRIGPEMREQLLQLVIAICNGQAERTARVALTIGETGRETDIHAFSRRIETMVLRHNRASIDSLPLGQVVLEIGQIAGDHDVTLPPELTTIGKTLLHLDEVGQTLDPAFNPKNAIEKETTNILRRHTLSMLKPTTYVDSALELRRMLDTAPRRLSKIIETLARDDRGFRIDAIDEDRLISGFTKIANRITVGLVIAALLMVGAMVMNVERAGPRFGEMPVISILSFAIASAGIVVMAFGIWWSDRSG